MWDSNFGEETFFDAAHGDRLAASNGGGMRRRSGYDVWLEEPMSVRERREMFLSQMGFVEPESCEALLSERRRSNGEADISGDYNHSNRDWLDETIPIIESVSETVVYAENFASDEVGKSPTVESRGKENTVSWWRRFAKKMKRNRGENVSNHVEGLKMKVEQNRKRFMECTSVFSGQDLKAHNGLIWTIKFSPDGKYLASGGADGVVCVWRVSSVEASLHEDMKKKKLQESVVLPEKIFHIEEEPLRKFQGHEADVLDLAWSTTNHLLSSSVDKTVRLWRADSDECLAVFQHSNYVTCVQFNPVDESYFISGSIDGKVRIWGIERRRVKDWANVKDIVTAVCYHPDGKEFVVGSVSGNCRFYEISGDELVLNAAINIQGRRKSSGNKITGIQFLKNDSQRVMITSEDSKIRILDGLEVVLKYKGLTKSGCQTSASFTSSGSHIVSVGEDSRVYLWNYEEDPSTTIRTTSSKQAKSLRSCESFFTEGVTVAIPWLDPNARNNYCCSCRDNSRTWDPERFSLASWFSMDGSSRASVTWPEEKLPLWDLPSAEHDDCGSRIASTAWGLVFVTANRDGAIRTFHNYGLPVRI